MERILIYCEKKTTHKSNLRQGKIAPIFIFYIVEKFRDDEEAWKEIKSINIKYTREILDILDVSAIIFERN